MATDWALSSGGATLEMTVSGGGAYANQAYVHDGNDTTYSRAYSTNGGGDVTYTITLPNTRGLTEIKFYVKGIVNGSAYGNITFSYYDGSWHDLATITAPSSTTWYTYNAGYANVSKIKVYCTTYYASGPGYYAEEYIYTITANGEYNDSGLRVQKSGSIVSIAYEPLLASHKLRFRKGGTTVGIPLVPTTDSLASPVRIYNGSAIKALMKYSP